MTDEQAKATQEVARTTGKLTEAVEKVGGFISKVIGGASTQFGGILEDWAKYYRYKNLWVIADKVEAIQARRKLDGQTIPIPPRAAIPMLESASLEDNDVLQEIWARLIANSTDPNFNEPPHPGYIEIIRQMSPDEAIILNSFQKIDGYPTLFTNHVPQQHESRGHLSWSLFSKAASYEGIYNSYFEHCGVLPLKSPADTRVYLDNLQRLQIVELGHDFSGEQMSGSLGLRYRASSDANQMPISIPARDEYLRMTSFGNSFVRACISENA
jgi:hypothetical protein